MATSHHIVLLGTGHLASQVERRLRQKKYDVIHISLERIEEHRKDACQQSIVEILQGFLRDAGADRAKAIFVLDDQDRYNIELALATISLNPAIPVIVSLFNEAIAPHIQATHQNLIVRNPALIAAPFFIECLDFPAPRRRHDVQSPAPWVGDSWIRANLWLYGLIAGFLFLVVCGSAFFRWFEGISWLDAFYLTTRMMTISDFGEVHASERAVKVMGIIVTLTMPVLVTVIFSFVADRLLKRRSEIDLGRKRYRLRNHVILCGLGRVGYQIVEGLLHEKKKVLVIEETEHNRFLEIVRSHGARVLIGDASLSKNLTYAGVENAAALFSVIDDDLKNLEIGLNARALRPDVRLVLRIFDKEIAEEMRGRLAIHFALSSSAIAAEQFVELLQRGEQAS